ncbi:MAG TPA: MMPL family transporter [Gemmataceae bacterium]|nr:MMPL family transporter [Gemmataceae bacterium]
MDQESVRSQEIPFPHRLLVLLVGTVCRFPRLVLAVSALLAGVSCYFFNTRLEYHTQRTDLISPNKDYQKKWREYIAEFGNDNDIVLVVQGANRQRMQEALDSLAGEVAKHPDLFDRLFYKVDLRKLHDRALLYLPTEQIEQIQGDLKSMHLLLEFAPISWQSLTLFSLLHEARDRAGKIMPGKPLKPEDEQFLGQLLTLAETATATLGDPAKYHNPWHIRLPDAPEQKDLLAEPQYFFSGDGGLAFLLARPIQEEGSFVAARKSVTKLRELVASVQPAFPELQFGLTGLPVLETDEMAAAQSDTKLASWLAIAGVTLLFFIVYRGIAYPLLTVGTLLAGTAWAMGWLTVTVGHLNILSATFAVMLIGMGDYGVLWVMRYEQARRVGADVRSALLHTAAHVAIGNLTAASTLALAFFAAMFADFQAVAELGWIAGCGVLLCALACFTVLPALLMVFDRRGQPIANCQSITIHAGWLPRLSSRSPAVIAAGLAITALMAFCAWRVAYDHNLLHLQARDLDSVKWEMTLIDHTAGASWHALSYRDTPEEARALKARYEQLPEVSRVVEVASLIPEDQQNKMGMLRDIRQRLHHLPERGALIPHARPDNREVKTELACLIGQLQPLADATEQPILSDLRRGLQTLLDQLVNMPIAEIAETRLQDFEQHLAGDLAENLYRLRDVSTPVPISLDDLPADLRVRYVGQNGKWLLRVFAKESLWNFAPLEHFSRQILTVDPDATGKPFATVEGLKSMQNGFQRAGIYAFLVIAGVLLVDFRNWRHMLIGLTPLVMGIILSLGIMGLCGLPLNPANVIAFPLILGVGVDNGVHVLHDWLLRRARGESTISYPIGRGVLVKALTTMIGFGTLMISSERGLASLGFILTLGVGCCMLSALVFLPAVLHMLSRGKQEATELEHERAYNPDLVRAA